MEPGYRPLVVPWRAAEPPRLARGRPPISAGGEGTGTPPAQKFHIPEYFLLNLAVFHVKALLLHAHEFSGSRSTAGLDEISGSFDNLEANLAEKEPGKLVHVTWRDSSQSHGWQDEGSARDCGPSICSSVGWIMRDDKDCLVLAASWSSGMVNDVTGIPWSCVVTVRGLNRRGTWSRF